MQRDVLEARAQQDLAGRVGVGHRERPGPAGRLVVLLGPLTIPRRSVCARYSQSLSSFRRHTTITSRPPGTSARRTLRSAATGLAKNIVPKRENAMSKRLAERRRPARRRPRSARWRRRPPRPRARAASMNRGARRRRPPRPPGRPARRCAGRVAEAAADVEHALARAAAGTARAPPRRAAPRPV